MGVDVMSIKSWIYPQSQPIIDYTSGDQGIQAQQQINNYNQNAYMSQQQQQAASMQQYQNQYRSFFNPLNIVTDEEMKFVEELRKTKLMKLAKA